jgi:hypothetical protein
LLRHNLDVMHIEKNVMDNILGTILDISEKKKDNLAARLDLQEMGLRPKLHLFIAANGKTYMPPACHTMSREDKENFLKVLRNVRVPDEYASNISRCVRLKERTISGLKSHDSRSSFYPLHCTSHCQIKWLDLLLSCLHFSEHMLNTAYTR